MFQIEIQSYCAHCLIAIGKVNAFRPEDIDALDAQITQCERLFPDTLRAISFESHGISPGGKKVFCAGADQKIRADWSNAQILDYLMYQRQVIHRLRLSPLGVISCVNGLALGLGTEICLASDIVLAGEDAAFGFPEKTWGIVPGAGGYAWAHGWAEHKEIAQQMIADGTPIDRERARFVGIADVLCDSEDFGLLSNHFAAELSKMTPEDQIFRKNSRHEKIDYKNLFDEEQTAYCQSLKTRSR